MLMRPSPMAFAVLVVLLGAGAAQAQTLNSEYTRLFGENPTNCAMLGANDSGSDPNFGDEINDLCEMAGAGPGSSASGTGASSNAAETAANRREERLEEESDDTDLGGGLNLFAAADYENIHRHRTTYEEGYSSDVWRGTAGADILVGDSLLLGGFFTYANSGGDFRGGGDFDTDSYTPTLFASLLPMDNMFVDVSVSYTRHEYDQERRASYTRVDGGNGVTTVTGDASGDTHGDQIGATFAFGYDHAIENIIVGPRAGLNFSYQNIDGFGENGSTGLELDFRDQYVTSLQSVVGLEATMAISTPFGVLSPRIGADYVHEFENDQRDIRVSLVQDLRTASTTPTGPLVFSFENQEPDRDFFRVGGGLVLTLPNGIQGFANVRTLVGNSHFDGVAGTVGVRLEM